MLTASHANVPAPPPTRSAGAPRVPPPAGAAASKRYVAALLVAAAGLAGAGFAPPPVATAVPYLAALAAGVLGGFLPALIAGALLSVGKVTLLPGEAAATGAAYLDAAVALLVAGTTGWLSDAARRSDRRIAEAESRSRALAAELELETRRTETVFQSVSDGITVQDAAGRMVFANAAAAQLLGYPEGTLLAGATAEEVFSRVHPRDEREQPLSPAALPGARALAGEAAPEQLISFRAADTGAERWALVRARAIRDDSGKGLLAVSAIHDLTERIRYERALESNARDLHQLTARLEVMVEQLRVERESALAARAEAEEALDRIVTLQRVTAALAEARTPDDVAGVVLERGIEVLGARSGALLGFAGDGDAIEVLRATGVPAETLERWARATPAEVARLRGALRPDEVEPATTLELHGSTAPSDALHPEVGAGRIVLVPLTARERALGVLVFEVDESRPVDPHDRDLLLALGRQCAQALDRAQLFAAERAARDEAEHASRAKSQFLAVMSHELRTPLNAILGYEELLETEVSGPISSIQKHHLTRIRESTRHLLALIEQILSLTRVQGGREDLRLEEVDATALAREVAEAIGPQIQRKGLAFELDLPRRAVHLVTDPRKVRQILLNVLSNAVKFTERGTVQVSLSTAEGMLHYTVRDTGLGIGDRDREQIFEPFVQVRSDGTVPSGTGLGLAVARELARHLGGDITLESRLGEGSAFTIRLPLARATPAPATPAQIGAGAATAAAVEH